MDSWNFVGMDKFCYGIVWCRLIISNARKIQEKMFLQTTSDLYWQSGMVKPSTVSYK